MSFLRRWSLALPAHGINGLSVVLGLGLVHLVCWILGGPAASLAAVSGAIFTSLPDTPLAPARTRLRVATGAVVGTLASVLALSLSTHPLGLGLLVALIGAVSAMTMAWGARAGPLSFVPILALVFSLAHPPTADVHDIVHHALWTLTGATLYWAWAGWVSRRLQPRLRQLAVASAFRALGELLRARGQLLALPATDTPDAQTALTHWIIHQAALDEQIQAARDLLFEAQHRPAALRLSDALLQAIELRDALMVSELDLAGLGKEDTAQDTRQALGDWLGSLGDALALQAQALEQAEPPPPVEVEALQARLRYSLGQWEGLAPNRLGHILLGRGEHLLKDLARLRAALVEGSGQALPPHDELLRFISAEGWPLASLGSQLHWHSPILRHAVRSALALTAAYALALWLPWASHPNWLVLSVAVVLRGNLEQTLSRRDARILGTLLGCLLVLALAITHVTALSDVIFLLAAGTAHAFVNRRYMITATAATIMALLQAHLMAPEGGFGVTERLLDTVLGAALAWGASYLFPWWEYRSIPMLAQRARRALAALTEEALRWPEASRSELPMRLARRQAYDAIGALALAARRTAVEPEAVRLPLRTLAGLLAQCHVLLAQLSGIRRLLSYRQAELDRRQVEPALQAHGAEIARILRSHLEEELPQTWPAPPPTQTTADFNQWLLRRLSLAELAACRVAQVNHELAQAARALRRRA